MRPSRCGRNANVDAGTRLLLPDRLPGFAAGSRARPFDGTFRESDPGVLSGEKSTGFVSIHDVSSSGSSISINRGGARDGKAHLSPPSSRLRERLPIHLAVRRRRILLVVEEGRLGFPATCRSGVDAGRIGIDRMQHTRRISIQRGISQTALAGRTDELPAQPSDELLPGLDVHHGRLDPAGNVSWRCGGPRIIAMWRSGTREVERCIPRSILCEVIGPCTMVDGLDTGPRRHPLPGRCGDGLDPIRLRWQELHAELGRHVGRADSHRCPAHLRWPRNSKVGRSGRAPSRAACPCVRRPCRAGSTTARSGARPASPPSTSS